MMIRLMGLRSTAKETRPTERRADKRRKKDPIESSNEEGGWIMLEESSQWEELLDCARPSPTAATSVLPFVVRYLIMIESPTLRQHRGLNELRLSVYPSPAAADPPIAEAV